MPSNDDNLERHLNAFSDLHDRRFQWQGRIVALSSAIFGFMASELLKVRGQLVQTLAFFALFFFVASIMYALWGQMRQLTRNISATWGYINDCTGQPRTAEQQASIDRLHEVRTRGSCFSLSMLGLFSAGVVLLMVTLFIATFCSAGGSAASNANSQTSQQSAVVLRLPPDIEQGLRDLIRSQSVQGAIPQTLPAPVQP